jgi:ABC-type phosphate transport system substrate-binding protein
MRVASFLLLGMLLLPQAGTTQEAEFKVVVSPETSVESLPRRDVARMFLKRTSSWPDGTAVIPVDQSSRSPVRLLFTREVLGVEGFDKMSAVENYWQQQIFSGRGSPPAVKASDADVIEFVAANPGAIGYVSATADVSSVRTLALED